MSDYDFRTLNDKEFEILCADLLGDAEGARFERFKPGRDSGIDGRYFRADGSEVVLQCKHWPNTPIEHLIRNLNKEEREKLKKLTFSKYLLAVSNPLSRNDKKQIFKALSPYMKSEKDIFGKEDLNDLLKNRPDTERRHYKLWLHSSAVIEHILNKPIFDRSSFSKEEISETTKKYVVTANHKNAMDKLESLNVVIITGEPGIGKTTLAEHLCLNYVADHYELIAIMDDMKEAEAVFDVNKKQIFYYDDFLGRNYLEALTGHEGKPIVQFMNRVTKFKNKKFVLTSRSTILNQGKILIDDLKLQNIDKNEYELTIKKLSNIDKAQILYNHIWHSALSSEFIDELYRDKRYREIIDHPNYNPRLISFITDTSRLESIAFHEYWEYIQDKLRNPADVWENPFDAQLDDYGRFIVLLVALHGKKQITHKDLSEAYSRLTSSPQGAGLNGKKDFLVNLRHLAKSLLSVKITTGSQSVVGLFNPSIGDYVLKRYSADLPALRLAVLSLRSLSSLATLWSLQRDGFITPDDCKQILIYILKNALALEFSGYTSSYIAEAASLLITLSGSVDSITRRALDFVCEQALMSEYRYVVRLFTLALEHNEISSDFIADFIFDACHNVESSDDLEALAALSQELDTNLPSYIDAMNKLRSCVVDYFIQNFSEVVDDYEAIDNNLYDDGLISVNESSLQRYIIHCIETRTEELGVELSPLEMKDIADSYDYRPALDDYIASLSRDYSPSGTALDLTPNIDEIDDIFERDRINLS